MENHSLWHEQKITSIKRNHRAKRGADSPDYSACNFVLAYSGLDVSENKSINKYIFTFKTMCVVAHNGRLNIIADKSHRRNNDMPVYPRIIRMHTIQTSAIFMPD